jgi:hypothetical protein
VTGAPLRFGERSKVGEAERDEPFADEPVMPAGPPPLRGPATEPEAADRAARDEPPTSRATPVVVAEELEAPPEPKAAPTDLANLRRRERKQIAKRRARKVKRIVRRLDAWSVLKVAFIFNLCAYIVSMVAGVVLWRVAEGAGVIENIESFIEDLGAFETYRFEPDLIFEAYALGGAVLAVLATGLIALGAVLFNLISDLVGGIRVTVIEEPGSMPARRRRSGGKGSEASGTVSQPPGATKA